MTISSATPGTEDGVSDAERWASLHAEMIRIRSFEDEAKALCFGGGVRGCTHLCQGRKLLFQ